MTFINIKLVLCDANHTFYSGVMGVSLSPQNRTVSIYEEASHSCALGTLINAAGTKPSQGIKLVTDFAEGRQTNSLPQPGER